MDLSEENPFPIQLALIPSLISAVKITPFQFDLPGMRMNIPIKLLLNILLNAEGSMVRIF